MLSSPPLPRTESHGKVPFGTRFMKGFPGLPTTFHMKCGTQAIYRCQGLAREAVAGGEWPPNTVDTQGRIKRDVRSKRFGVSLAISRSGPTPTRLVNGVCLVSASHRPRPRIGSLDRMTCASTRGGSSALRGLCPHSPPGPGPSAPVQGPLRPPDPRFGLDRTPPRSLQRRFALGRTVVGRVGEVPSTDLPLGGGTLTTPRWELVLAGLHPHPGMATPVRRPVSTGHWTWDLRDLIAGPASAGPSIIYRPFVHVTGSDLGRSHPTCTGRQVAVLRSGLGRSLDLDDNVRSPRRDPASAGDLPGLQRPSPGGTTPLCGAPQCGLGRTGLPYTGVEKSTASEGPRPSRLGGFTPTRPRIAPG